MKLLNIPSIFLALAFYTTASFSHPGNPEEAPSAKHAHFKSIHDASIDVLDATKRYTSLLKGGPASLVDCQSQVDSGLTDAMEKYCTSLIKNNGEGQDVSSEHKGPVFTLYTSILNDCWLKYLNSTAPLSETATTRTVVSEDPPESEHPATVFEVFGNYYWEMYLDGHEEQALELAARYYSKAIQLGSRKVKLFFQRFGPEDYTSYTLQSILGSVHIYKYPDTVLEVILSSIVTTTRE